MRSRSALLGLLCLVLPLLMGQTSQPTPPPRVLGRTVTATTATTLTPTVGTYARYVYTALASDLTIQIPGGVTPQNGETLLFDITSNASSHTLSFTLSGTGSFAENLGTSAPTTIAANGRVVVMAMWTTSDSKWNIAYNNTGILGASGGGLGVNASAETGIVRFDAGVADFTELSGDCTTSGSNALTCTKLNGTTPFNVNAQTGTYQVLAGDFSGYKTISVASGTFTITLVASGTQPLTGQSIKVINYGSGVVTIARSGQNINGGTTSLTLNAGSATDPSSAFVVSNGTDYFAAVQQSRASLPDANTTTKGIVELAVYSEVDTGTSTSLAVTPDALAGSIFGTKHLEIECIEDATDLPATGDGKCYFRWPDALAGFVVVETSVHLGAALGSGAVTVGMDMCGATTTGIRCSGTNRDLFSTPPSIEAGEQGSESGTVGTINGSNNTIAAGEWLRVNLDANGTSGAKGLYVIVGIRKP